MGCHFQGETTSFLVVSEVNFSPKPAGLTGLDCISAPPRVVRVERGGTEGRESAVVIRRTVVKNVNMAGQRAS